MTTNVITTYVDIDGDGIADQKHVKTIETNYVDQDGDGSVDAISRQTSTQVQNL